MEISSQALPRSRRRYIIKQSASEVGAYFAKALTNLSETVKVAGFRPGKAPLELVRAQLDESNLRREAYSLAVQQAWDKLTKALKELPIQDPEVDLKLFDENKGSEIIFEFDIRPEVKVGSWQKIKIVKDEDRGVSDKEVDEMIDSLRRAHAKTVIKLTPAKRGDRVEVTFTGSIKGIRQDNLGSKHFPLILGHSNTIPGFEDKIIGLKKGDEKKFSLNFPADHYDKNLAGKKVDFEVVVDEVFEVILPDLDKNFAAKFGHNTVESLKGAIKADIESRKTNDTFVKQKAKWLAEFHKLVKTDVPQSLVDAEVERSREHWRQFLRERNLNEKDWLKSRKVTLEQMEADWQRAAEGSVAIGLGIAEIAKEQKKDLKSNEDFQGFLDDLIRKAIAK